MSGPLKADMETLRRRKAHLETKVKAFEGSDAPSAQYDRRELGALSRIISWIELQGGEESPRRDHTAQKLRVHEIAERYRKELPKVEEILAREAPQKVKP